MWLVGYAVSIVVKVVCVWSNYSFWGRLEVAFRAAWSSVLWPINLLAHQLG